MDVLSVCLIVFGFVGLFVSLALAVSFRKEKGSLKIVLIVGLIFAVMMIVGIAIYLSYDSPNVGDSENSARCPICNTRYSYDEGEYGSAYDNVRSINRRNMCERCYRNYQYAMG